MKYCACLRNVLGPNLEVFDSANLWLSDCLPPDWPLSQWSRHPEAPRWPVSHVWWTVGVDVQGQHVCQHDPAVWWQHGLCGRKWRDVVHLHVSGWTEYFHGQVCYHLLSLIVWITEKFVSSKTLVSTWKMKCYKVSRFQNNFGDC